MHAPQQLCMLHSKHACFTATMYASQQPCMLHSNHACVVRCLQLSYQEGLIGIACTVTFLGQVSLQLQEKSSKRKLDAEKELVELEKSQAPPPAPPHTTLSFPPRPLPHPTPFHPSPLHTTPLHRTLRHPAPPHTTLPDSPVPHHRAQPSSAQPSPAKPSQAQPSTAQPSRAQTDAAASQTDATASLSGGGKARHHVAEATCGLARQRRCRGSCRPCAGSQALLGWQTWSRPELLVPRARGAEEHHTSKAPTRS